MAATKVRKTVPLDAEDARGVARVRADVVWQEVVVEMAGIELSESPSEAEAIHALLAVGHKAVADRVSERRMTSGYAALAASRTDEDRALARATSRRTAARLGRD